MDNLEFSSLGVTQKIKNQNICQIMKLIFLPRWIFTLLLWYVITYKHFFLDMLLLSSKHYHMATTLKGKVRTF